MSLKNCFKKILENVRKNVLREKNVSSFTLISSVKE
jgi:hypothetical protein